MLYSTKLADEITADDWNEFFPLQYSFNLNQLILFQK